MVVMCRYSIYKEVFYNYFMANILFKFSKHTFKIPASEIFLDDDFLLKPKPFVILNKNKNGKAKKNNWKDN